MQTIEISDAAFNRVKSRCNRTGESISTIILKEIKLSPEPRCIICDEVNKTRTESATEWSDARKKLGLD